MVIIRISIAILSVFCSVLLSVEMAKYPMKLIGKRSQIRSGVRQDDRHDIHLFLVVLLGLLFA